MEEIKYRAATAADIPTICAFRKTQLARNGTVQVEGIDDDLTAFFDACFQNDTIHQIFAYTGDKIVATGAVLFYSYPPSHVNKSGKIAYISNMYTLPDYRNKGIATHIIALLEEEAKRRGITNAKLGATPMGKGIYEHAGYVMDELYSMIKKLQ